MTFYNNYLEQQDITYLEYLSSNIWRNARDRVLKRDKNTCRAYKCTNKATEVHHMSYEDDVMSGKNDKKLISLCEDCHTRGHLNGRGNLSLANRWILTGITKKPSKIKAMKLQQDKEAKWVSWKTRKNK